MQQTPHSNFKVMKNLIFVILLFVSLSSFGQKKLEIDGRIEGMPIYWANSSSGLDGTTTNKKLLSYTELNNRINLKWLPNKTFNFEVGLRNQYIFGDLLYQVNTSLDQAYNKLLSYDNGFLTLTKVWHQNVNGIFYSNLDRLVAQLEWKKWNLKVGRQRINWGINLVWQPNDIFNTFNYLNFNYPERPGADAVRVQYYTGSTSSIDVAYKIDHEKRSTYAAKYAFNRWNYDWQMMAGVMNQEYFVAGMGFSGDIKGAGFTGEASWFSPVKIDTSLHEALLASISMNYTFTNGIFIHSSVLYNSSGTTEKAGRPFFMTLENISTLDYTLSKAQIFGQVSYTVNPIWQLDLSGIVNPFDGSFYLGPSVGITLTNDISLFFIAQTFFGEDNSEFGNFGQMYFARIQWNFSN